MTALDLNYVLKDVDGHDNVTAFRYDFVPEGKAVDDAHQLVTELDDGDLLIEGYAAVFEGIDRQGENFTDGAFQRGIKAFIDGPATLAYHHDRSKALGKVLELQEEEGKGLHMKARVDGAIRQHPELGTYYEQIKKGTLKALSIGGFFKRKLTEAGWRIADCDFTEISVTPVPVHTGPSFAVVAGKALTSDLRVPDNVAINHSETTIREQDFYSIQYALDELSSTLARIGKRGETDDDKSDAETAVAVDLT